MAWRYSPACLLFFLGTAVATPPGGPPVAPDVRIVSPTTGFATNAGVLDVAVAFEAREDGRGNVQDVDLLVDGVLAQTFRNRPDRKSGTHVFRVDLSARGEVPVRFQARAYQGNRAAGLCGVSVEVAVVVDRTPPVVAALFPADGEVVTSLRPEIGAVYGDALSGVDAASVRLFLDDRDVTPQSVVTQAAVRFVPDDDLSEGVHIVHLALSDRAGNGVEAMAAWTLVVSPPVTAGSAFLDGIVFDAATELPLQGVRVIAQGIQGAVFTDARGRFAFPAPGAGAPGAGEFLLEMTREGYHYANRRVLGTSGRDVAVEPVFLLPVGSITQISAAEGGVAASSDGSVVVTFPPGAVLHDTDVKITPILLSRDLPSLPLDNAAFVAAFFGEPSIVFERPLTVRMLNRPGLPAGTPVPIGFWDRASQEWIDGGQGRVTDDGLYIEGIWTRFSSGGFFLASLRQAGDRAWQAVETAADFAVDVGRAIADPAGFSTGFKRGDLSLAHDLPPLRSLGSQRTLSLAYDSRTADTAVLTGHGTLVDLETTRTPLASRARLTFEGEQGEAFFASHTGDAQVRQLFAGANGRGLPLRSGVHFVTADLSNEYPANYATTTRLGGEPVADLGVSVPGNLLLRNRVISPVAVHARPAGPLGAGWGVAGVSRLWPGPEGFLLAAEGDGSSMVFGRGAAVRVDTGFRDAVGVTFDAAGNYYVVEDGPLLFRDFIWKVTPDGALRVLSPRVFNPSDIARDRDGGLLFVNSFSDMRRITPEGVHVDTPLSFHEFGPIGQISADPLVSDVVYVVTRASPPAPGTLVRGDVRTGLLERVAVIPSSYGIALDSRGTIYVSTYPTDSSSVPPFAAPAIDGGGKVLKVTRDGRVSDFVSGLQRPLGMTCDADDNLYVADYGTGQVLKVTPEGRVSVFATGLAGPWDVATRIDGSVGVILERDASAARVLGDGFASLGGDFSRIRQEPDGSYVRTWPDGTVQEYTEEGLQTSGTDRTGNRTSYTYTDADGDGLAHEISSIRVPSGAAPVGWDFLYSSGRLAGVRDTSGRITGVEVDGAGNLSRFVNPDGTFRSFAYDAEHRCTRSVDERTLATDCLYDARGLLTEVLFPERTGVRVDAGGTPSASLTRESRRFAPQDGSALLDDLPPGTGTQGNPAPVLRPEAVLATFEDGDGSSYAFRTDSYGAAREIADPLGRVTTAERDRNGDLTLLRRSNLSEARFDRDANGNVLRFREDALSAEARFAYSNFQEVTLFDDFEGKRTSISYDAVGNPTAVVNALLQRTEVDYESHGLPIAARDALGREFRFRYDPGTLNLAEIEDPLHRITRIRYTPSGDVREIETPDGRITRFFLDAMGRLVEAEDPLLHRTGYRYLPSGDLEGVRDARGFETTFGTSEAGLLSSTRNPLGQTDEYFYTAGRDLSAVRNARGQEILLHYDEAHRLRRKFLPGGEVVEFDYNDLGFLTLARDGDSSVELSYDLTGRLTGARMTLPHFSSPVALSYVLDRNGNRRPMNTATPAPRARGPTGGAAPRGPSTAPPSTGPVRRSRCRDSRRSRPRSTPRPY